MDDEQVTDPTEPVIEETVEPVVAETVVTEPVIEAPEPEPLLDIRPSTFDPATPVAVPKPQITPSIPDEPPVPPAPPITIHPSPVTPTFDVASLSDEQLRAAATLFTKRNQPEISRKGVAKRRETMELNLREIVDFLSLNNGSPLPRIAKHTNNTPGTTSKYLRQLIASGKVRADGWGKTRRYYLK